MSIKVPESCQKIENDQIEYVDGGMSTDDICTIATIVVSTVGIGAALMIGCSSGGSRPVDAASGVYSRAIPEESAEVDLSRLTEADLRRVNTSFFE